MSKFIGKALVQIFMYMGMFQMVKEMQNPLAKIVLSIAIVIALLYMLKNLK